MHYVVVEQQRRRQPAAAVAEQLKPPEPPVEPDDLHRANEQSAAVELVEPATAAVAAVLFAVVVVVVAVKDIVVHVDSLNQSLEPAAVPCSSQFAEPPTWPEKPEPVEPVVTWQRRPLQLRPPVAAEFVEIVAVVEKLEM